MLEIQEDRDIKKSDPQTQEINAGWQKYNKRLNNLLDDAQIKNVWETKKRVRTKNSKLTIISAITISLIVLIAIQNKQYFNSPLSSLSKKASGTSNDEFPLKPSADKTESTDHQLTTNKNKKPESDQTIESRDDKITPFIKKRSITDQPLLEKISIPTQNKEFFVQIGAFFIKDNATKLVKKLKSIGSKAEILIRNVKSTQHQVSLGNFTQKDHAASSSTKIKTLGFNPTIKKNGPAYILELGLFTKKKDATIFAKKLKNNGLNPNQKIVTINQKVYIVRSKGISTESKARQTRKSLINLGFKNSFIQFPLNQSS
ncbi:SPOR domain-containing protein [Nitrospinaceae bacterium]|nr:SPOR domain-containing protein [Nitrospinaceae bacterium]